jgi:hypothetical protein
MPIITSKRIAVPCAKCAQMRNESGSEGEMERSTNEVVLVKGEWWEVVRMCVEW